MAFALIVDGSVAEVADAMRDVVPQWTWVDVSAVTPQPQRGWGATQTNGSWVFTAPAAAPSPAQAGSAPAVPDSVSMFQAQYVLMQTPSATPGVSLLDLANKAVAAAGPTAQLAWNKATVLYRNSPLVASIAAALQLQDAQIDAMFVAAAKVTA